MVDVIDVADEQYAAAFDADLKEVRRKANAVPPKHLWIAGECDLCGEESGRLVEGVCARCRDRYKLK